jgi:hypothetical protein
MLDQSQVDAWLGDFVTKVRDRFEDRLIFVGHIGSWARGEPNPESDIDCLVVLDRVNENDISTLRNIFQGMSDGEFKAGGILVSCEELDQTPAFHLVQLFYHGCKALYGSIEGQLTAPSVEDYITDVRLKACDNLHTARHHLLFSRDLSESLLGLKFNFYNCFFALQNWLLATQGKYIARKSDMLDYLDDPDDAEVVRVARDWYKLSDELTAHAQRYVELLERWGRKMLKKLDDRTNVGC